MKKTIQSLILGAVLMAPVFAGALTLDELQARLQADLLQLQSVLKGQVLGAHTDDVPDTIANTDGYCPNLTVTMRRGARDATTGGQVSELQRFIADYFDLDEEEIVTGYFGRMTERYIIRFQNEHGLPAYGIVGSLTRAKIAEVCKGNGGTGNLQAYPTSGPAPLSVDFWSVIGNDSSNGYSFDFGDGTSAQGTVGCGVNPRSGANACPRAIVASHTYSQSGTYIAKLTKTIDWCAMQTNMEIACTRPVEQKVIGTVTISVGQTTGNTTFSGSPTSGAAPLAVNFTLSNIQNAGTYYIDYGDGSNVRGAVCRKDINGENSCGNNWSGTHTYANAGTYTAVASYAPYCGPGMGCPAMLMQVGTVTITVTGTGTGTSMSANPSAGAAPLTTTFTINAPAGTYLLDFEDGQSQNVTLPVIYCITTPCNSTASVSHTYTQSGNYTAKLLKTVDACAGWSNPNISCTRPVTVEVIATASVSVTNGTTSTPSFTASQSSGRAPLWVSFSLWNASQTGTYYIDFGDGTDGQWSEVSCGGTSTGRCFNTTHTYAKPGTYTATATVAPNCPAPQGAVCTMVLGIVGTLTITVTGDSATTPSFTASPTSGSAPLAVTYSVSGGANEDYVDFGDGQRLAINGAGGSVTHFYYTPGAYTARLLKKDQTPYAGVNPIQISVTSGGGTSNPRFSAAPTSGASPLNVSFTLTGGQSSGRYYIDFGDGTDGTWNETGCPQPVGDGMTMPGRCFQVSHIFASPGTYTAQATYAPSCPTGTNCAQALQLVGTVTVTVSGGGSVKFDASPKSGMTPLTVNFSLTGGQTDGSYYIDFGDGTDGSWMPANCGIAANGRCFTSTHTYTGAGNYTAQATYAPNCPATGYGVCSMALALIGTVQINAMTGWY